MRGGGGRQRSVRREPLVSRLGLGTDADAAVGEIPRHRDDATAPPSGVPRALRRARGGGHDGVRPDSGDLARPHRARPRCARPGAHREGPEALRGRGTPPRPARVRGTARPLEGAQGLVDARRSRRPLPARSDRHPLGPRAALPRPGPRRRPARAVDELRRRRLRARLLVGGGAAGGRTRHLRYPRLAALLRGGPQAPAGSSGCSGSPWNGSPTASSTANPRRSCGWWRRGSARRPRATRCRRRSRRARRAACT